MKLRIPILPASLLTALFCGFWLPASAHAQLLLTGETVLHVDELSGEVEAKFLDEHPDFRRSADIGFAYRRFDVFFLTFWTWNGRFVVYEPVAGFEDISGNKRIAVATIQEFSSEDWEGLIGNPPRSLYTRPLSFRFPAGLMILLSIGAAVALQKGVSWLTEPRRLISETLEAEIKRDLGYSEGVFYAADSTRVDAAVRNLRDLGFKASDALEAVSRINDELLFAQEDKIEGTFGVAARLEQQGEWDQSSEIYESLLQWLPSSDSRVAFARNCLAAIAEKRQC